MKETISIAQFVRAIQRLPEDEPQIRPGIWYKPQKEHWLAWLDWYEDPYVNCRNADKEPDARFTCNHIGYYHMLLWIISATEKIQISSTLREELRHMPPPCSRRQPRSEALCHGRNWLGFFGERNDGIRDGCTGSVRSISGV